MWAEVVLVRRWMRAPSTQAARPYREFAVMFFLSVVAIAFDLLGAIGAVPLEISSLVNNLLFLANLVGFTFVYVNNASIPTTFRVKIVGASLFAVLAVLTVMWTALASDWPKYTTSGQSSDSVAALSAHPRSV